MRLAGSFGRLLLFPNLLDVKRPKLETVPPRLECRLVRINGPFEIVANEHNVFAQGAAQQLRFMPRVRRPLTVLPQEWSLTRRRHGRCQCLSRQCQRSNVGVR